VNPRTLLLVSANASDDLRRAVAAGERPRPEYLELERRGMELLDWSRLPGRPKGRSNRTSVLHAAAALVRLRHVDVVFSDGEQVGIPLALAMRLTGVRTSHLMLGHHLTNGRKPALVRRLGLDERIDRVVFHSPRQVELAEQVLGLAPSKLVLDPYYADTEFWRPRPHIAEEPLLVAAGREHRDYATLVEACTGRPERVFVAAGSTHSPAATARMPPVWPERFEVDTASPAVLRDLYARASVVVVPVVENDFQAGVTVVLEAMAMGKAVVATAARGWAGVIEDGVEGLLVPPGDAVALRTALTRVLDDPWLRSRLGRAARDAAVSRYSLSAFADRLQALIEDLTPSRAVAV
jgi:glycosyltransferase involved in cell wall biosynthesis